MYRSSYRKVLTEFEETAAVLDKKALERLSLGILEKLAKELK